MQRSESIKELAIALNRFQSQVTGAKKSSKNPIFNSKYADLKEIWETINEHLADTGLSVSQVGIESPPDTIAIETILLHSSGEWLSGVTTLNLVAPERGGGLKLKNDPQSAGSAITYARRYGLSAILGIYQEDDDGNTFQQKPSTEKPFNPDPTRNRIATKLAGKDTDAGTLEHYAELLAASNTLDEFANIEKKVDALPNKPAQPDAVKIKKECAMLLQQLIDAKIDGFDTEVRRHNSFVKHLNTDTLNDCKDVTKLQAYKTYLNNKLSMKPPKTANNEAKPESKGNIQAEYETLLNTHSGGKKAKLTDAISVATEIIAKYVPLEEQEDLVKIAKNCGNQNDIDIVIGNIQTNFGETK